MKYTVKIDRHGADTFETFDDALRFAALCGVKAHYDCDDGRTFLYLSQADCDRAENGTEVGAIELIGLAQ